MLLYTLDREHDGTLILGIFNSSEDAWDLDQHSTKTN